jgi:hypothetical protein
VRSGRFTLDDAVGLAALEDGGRALLRPAIDMVAHLGVVDVDAAGADDLAHGRRVRTAPGAPGEVAVRDAEGALVAVATRDADGSLRPTVVLPRGERGGDE